MNPDKIKDQKSTLTVIPAKLGSIRVKKKNISTLAGKPLITYTIDAALSAGVCGEVMVSTESSEIAEIAEKAGAHVPFMRPDRLSKDPYGVVDVCIHVLDEYEKLNQSFKKLIILLPTSPFRSIDDIQESNRIFNDSEAKFLMSVSEFGHNPFGALYFEKNEQTTVNPCFPGYIGKKTKEVPKTFRANGAICIVDVAAFREAGTYYGTPLHAYVMPWHRSIDIDTEIDFKFAEYLIKTKAIKHVKT